MKLNNRFVVRCRCKFVENVQLKIRNSHKTGKSSHRNVWRIYHVHKNWSFYFSQQKGFVCKRIVWKLKLNCALQIELHSNLINCLFDFLLPVASPPDTRYHIKSVRINLIRNMGTHTFHCTFVQFHLHIATNMSHNFANSIVCLCSIRIVIWFRSVLLRDKERERKTTGKKKFIECVLAHLNVNDAENFGLGSFINSTQLFFRH